MKNSIAGRALSGSRNSRGEDAVGPAWRKQRRSNHSRAQHREDGADVSDRLMQVSATRRCESLILHDREAVFFGAEQQEDPHQEAQDRAEHRTCQRPSTPPWSMRQSVFHNSSWRVGVRQWLLCVCGVLQLQGGRNGHNCPLDNTLAESTEPATLGTEPGYAAMGRRSAHTQGCPLFFVRCLFPC